MGSHKKLPSESKNTMKPISRRRTKSGRKKGMDRRGVRVLESHLIPALDNETFGDALRWIDRDEGIFRISWMNQKRKNWDATKDSAVWLHWDDKKKRRHSNPIQSKQRFRNALKKCEKEERLTALPVDESDKDCKVYKYNNIKEYRQRVPSNHDSSDTSSNESSSMSSSDSGSTSSEEVDMYDSIKNDDFIQKKTVSSSDIGSTSPEKVEMNAITEVNDSISVPDTIVNDGLENLSFCDFEELLEWQSRQNTVKENQSNGVYVVPVGAQSLNSSPIDDVSSVLEEEVFYSEQIGQAPECVVPPISGVTYDNNLANDTSISQEELLDLDIEDLDFSTLLAEDDGLDIDLDFIDQNDSVHLSNLQPMELFDNAEVKLASQIFSILGK